MPEQPQERTDFSFLSQEAQDAIIWAVMSLPGETPPVLSDTAKKEIMEWRDNKRINPPITSRCRPNIY